MTTHITPIQKLNSSTYQFEIGKNNYDDDIVIGKSDAPDFKPHVQLSRFKWGRYPVDVNIELKTNATGIHKQVKEKIKFETPDFDYYVYGKQPSDIEGMPLSESGGLELELILKKKPVTNVFEWLIDAPDLDFFYQPELTQQEKNEGLIRPENVIGSYAVYHKTACDCHKDPLVTPTNIRLGGMKSKAFHIYRPQLIDGSENKSWGILSYSNGLLRVTIPNAIYNNPNTNWLGFSIDPTLGYTSIGASDDAVWAQIASGDYTMPETGDVTGIFLASSGNQQQWVGGAWDDDNNPDALLMTGSTLDLADGFSESVISPAVEITGSTLVWIGGVRDDQGNQETVKYDDTSIDGKEVGGVTVPQDPFGSPTTRTGRQYSVYFEYTAAGGAAPFIPKIRWSELLTNPMLFFAAIFAMGCIRNTKLNRRNFFNPFKWMKLLIILCY